MEIGAQSLRTYVVQPQETAMAFESGDLEVLATPRLVGMFESVAKDMLGATLTPENTSVGVHIDLKHLKATAVGQTVEIMVTVTAIEGRRYTFALRAVDASNDVIGEGTHTRVVVNRQRFLEGLKK
ncbi:MAG: thioesterase family protein [Bacteroides sp.]